jgi:putative transcriptional regulator
MRNQVREQRTQREMSQAELAAALGVSRQTVISIESGRYLPSLPLAFAIARTPFAVAWAVRGTPSCCSFAS